jgi:L-malate glycosyltransferase
MDGIIQGCSIIGIAAAMNICYLTLNYTVHDRRFLQAIADLHHNCWYAAWNPIKLSEYADVASVANVLSEMPVNIMSGDELNILLNARQIDIVHAGPIPTVAAGIAGKIHVPLVAMSWGSDILVDIDDNDHLMRQAVTAIRHADALICDSNAVRDKICRIVDNDPPEIISFPWGIKQQRYLQRDKAVGSLHRHALGWDDEVVFLSVRNWEPHYQLEKLIHAFHSVVSEIPNARLILAGTGSLKGRIDELISDLNLNKYLYCPGNISEHELLALYDAADVFVNTSRSDGTSISLLEAMICGLPAIVNSAYGNLEWITHNLNGWTVDCANVPALAGVMRYACHHSSQWEAMGEHSMSVVSERANWDSNYPLINQAYDAAIRAWQPNYERRYGIC